MLRKIYVSKSAIAFGEYRTSHNEEIRDHLILTGFEIKEVKKVWTCSLEGKARIAYRFSMAESLGKNDIKDNIKKNLR